MSFERHEIPTHLGVEDKAFLGLSIRQAMYLILGASTSYGVATQADWLPAAPRLAVAGLAGLLALAVALVRPGGRGLDEWGVILLRFLVAPRRAIWRVSEPDPADWRAPKDRWTVLELRSVAGDLPDNAGGRPEFQRSESGIPNAAPHARPLTASSGEVRDPRVPSPRGLGSKGG
jgi:hypothetical protein